MGRQVFTAGEILTAASMNDLGDQTVMVFDDATDRATAIPTPVEGMVTYLKDTDEVDKFDGTDFVPVGIAPAILQVVSTTLKTTFITASTTYTPVTGLDATITPSSTSSKILVMASVSIGRPNDQAPAGLTVFRDTTNVVDPTSPGSRTAAASWEIRTQTAGGIVTMGQIMNVFAFTLTDLPATTSALTYSVQALSKGSTVFVNRSATDTDNANHSRGVSSITVMEVAG